ncbi:MAG: carbohydrate binding domain-containing protein [Flavobacterium sp.]|nr:carbohydrate binding domain-containing protein [Flavobacterium sp.]
MKKLYTLLAFVAISATTNAQNNLIINGDFEAWTEGLPNSWFTTGSTVAQSTSVFYGGTSSISLTAPASSNKTISPTTDIPVTQGVTYVFSGWYLDNDANAKFKIGINLELRVLVVQILELMHYKQQLFLQILLHGSFLRLKVCQILLNLTLPHQLQLQLLHDQV